MSGLGGSTACLRAEVLWKVSEGKGRSRAQQNGHNLVEGKRNGRQDGLVRAQLVKGVPWSPGQCANEIGSTLVRAGEGICGKNREEKGREGKGNAEETVARMVVWFLVKLVIMSQVPQ